MDTFTALCVLVVITKRWEAGEEGWTTSRAEYDLQLYGVPWPCLLSSVKKVYKPVSIMWLSIDGLWKKNTTIWTKCLHHKGTLICFYGTKILQNRTWDYDLKKEPHLTKNYHLSRKIYWENAFGEKPDWNKVLNSTIKHDTIRRKWIYKPIRIQIRDPTVGSGYGPARLCHTEWCCVNESSFSPKHPFTSPSTVLFVSSVSC